MRLRFRNSIEEMALEIPVKSSLSGHTSDRSMLLSVIPTNRVFANKTTRIMNRQIRQYTNQAEDSSGQGPSASEHTIDVAGGINITGEEGKADAERLTSTQTDAKDEEGDSTILGAGGLAGGLSGDGERTNEYDAAVMRLDD
ncbi:hypothetical protein [Spirosoma fluviale]|uniref:Uncharacterized protein n=1 Tax=Spirosoma fluviale TaxID=1597977 RepID=A0A286G393_9BACT|nr:hypothetical protein [Spirosoma fluviale]SOD89985.1 hypothetical protein SAMN06269250_3257 [Spirosoma fluviale]